MPTLSDDLSDFARAIVCGEEPPLQIDTSNQNYSAAIAIEVYRNNYRGNLQGALAGAYPIIKQLVGADFFQFLSQKFIGQYPSKSANLHHYGAELANFLTAFAPAQALVYLPNVAALEWACHVAYFMTDEAALDLDKLALIPSGQYAGLVLHTHPACQVVRSRYPITAIWQAHQPGADSDFHIDLDSGPSIALVSRLADVVQVGELTEADADWLQGIQAGVSLGAATVSTLEHYADFDLQAVLLNMAAQNVLTDFNLGATP